MAITTNIHSDTLTRGDTYIKKITVKNTDETPKDITGATGRYTMKTPGVDGTLILQKTTGSGIQLTSPSVGVLHITVDPAETALLIPGVRIVDDCELTLGTEVMTVAAGILTIIGDIST